MRPGYKIPKCKYDLPDRCANPYSPGGLCKHVLGYQKDQRYCLGYKPL